MTGQLATVQILAGTEDQVVHGRLLPQFPAEHLQFLAVTHQQPAAGHVVPVRDPELGQA